MKWHVCRLVRGPITAIGAGTSRREALGNFAAAAKGDWDSDDLAWTVHDYSEASE